MISNQRQYKITRKQLSLLKQAAKSFDFESKSIELNSRVLAKAEIDALESEIQNLEDQIVQFETLQNSVFPTLTGQNLSQLPQLLIQARIIQHLSQKELAELVGIKEQQIQRYEAEKYKSASLERLLEISKALKLNITEIAEIEPINIFKTEEKSEKLEVVKFPIKEMYKRGWFEGFTGSLSDAQLESDQLINDFFAKVNRKPEIAFHRKKIRTGSSLDKYGLAAWECRILHLAQKDITGIKFYETSLNDNWIYQFIKLSQLPDGPVKAKEKLLEIGIKLVIEPHLPGTFLDGAAMLKNENPIIGMTLRYDRLDNFWFVLIHELVHIKHHIRKGKIESILDDLESPNVNEIEKDADRITSELLIPNKEWTNSIVRFVQSEEAITNFAKKLEINPAIVAGYLRHETNNYTIHKNLIGQGDVRKQFEKVEFGM